MGIADHVSRAMLSRDSHVPMRAKRRALDKIAIRSGSSPAGRTTKRRTRDPFQVRPQRPARRGLILKCQSVAPSAIL